MAVLSPSVRWNGTCATVVGWTSTASGTAPASRSVVVNGNARLVQFRQLTLDTSTTCGAQNLETSATRASSQLKRPGVSRGGNGLTVVLRSRTRRAPAWAQTAHHRRRGELRHARLRVSCTPGSCGWSVRLGSTAYWCSHADSVSVWGVPGGLSSRRLERDALESRDAGAAESRVRCWCQGPCARMATDAMEQRVGTGFSTTRP